MDRDFDIENRSVPVAAPDVSVALSREREPYELGPYEYRLSPAERETMAEIGRFRTVAVADLARYQYRGRTDQMGDDLGSLRAQGLLQIRTVWNGPESKKLAVAVLTKPGKRLLERGIPVNGRPAELPEKQAVYSGFVKPAEVRHDAAIYRMYQVEREKIERSGGRIRRIVLDYELKRNVYTPLAKAKPTLAPAAYVRKQAEVAGQNGLKVIGGKILLPDLRIEYEAQGGASAFVDLELATHHYRGGMMRGKAQAGFKLYAPAESASRMAAAFDPDLVAQIFSF